MYRETSDYSSAKLSKKNASEGRGMTYRHMAIWFRKRTVTIRPPIPRRKRSEISSLHIALPWRGGDVTIAHRNGRRKEAAETVSSGH
jgi:hypothetical protein